MTEIKKEEDASSMTKQKAQEEENRLRELLKKKAEERKSNNNNSSSNDKNANSNNIGKNNGNGGKGGGAPTEASTTGTASSATTNSNKRRRGRNRRRRRKRQGRRMAAAATAAAGNAPPPMMVDNRYYGQEPPHHPPPYYRRAPPPPRPYGYGRHPPPYMDRGPPDYHRYDGRYHRYNGGGGYPPPPHLPDDYWRYSNNNGNIPPRPPPPDSHRGRRRSISRSISRSRSSSSRSSYSSYSRSSSVSSYSSRSRSNSRSRRRSNSPARHDDEDVASHSSSSTAKDRSKRSRSLSSNNDKKSVSDSKNNINDDDTNSTKKETNTSATNSNSNIKEDVITKDQRTIFVSQLVMRADERDIRRYFRKKCNSKVNDVILLRDRRTGRHKGCAYVELGRLEDIPKALQLSGIAPDFQRFPILVKASEAEKNYTVKPGEQLVNANNLLLSTSMPGIHNGIVAGNRIESQKVYVGSIDRNVVQAHLQSIFYHFGNLEKVLLQIDTATGLSRGFAFLSFKDPKTSNLAIQAMSGQMLAGRALKTGWASQNSNIPGVQEVTSDEFPADAANRVQAVHVALAQLNGTGLIATPSLVLIPGVSSLFSGATVPTSTAGSITVNTMGEDKPQATNIANVAEEAINVALGLSSNTALPSSSIIASITPETEANDPKKVGGSESPTASILVHNMYDKDEETDDGWEEDIKQEFEDECSKFGKLCRVIVMYTEPGGKIYAVFDTVEGAKACAESLAGRYFDKRIIRVEFVKNEQVPK